MDDFAFEAKLKDAMRRLGLKAEHRHFDVSCHSVAEAAAAVGGVPEDFVKNVCFVAPDDKLVMCIVKGEDKVDKNLAAKAVGVPKLAQATPEQILEKTGFPCGGTPSFGFSAVFLIDERVMEKQTVWTGGGSQHSLVQIAPVVLLKANGGRVCRVRKA